MSLLTSVDFSSEDKRDQQALPGRVGKEDSYEHET